jgi:hypothetical protein
VTHSALSTEAALVFVPRSVRGLVTVAASIPPPPAPGRRTAFFSISGEETVAAAAFDEGYLPVVFSDSPGRDSGAFPAILLDSRNAEPVEILAELIVRPPGCGRASLEILPRLCRGVLMPLFLHNLSNLLVGVVGNLDLAAMYPSGSENTSKKLAEGKQAATEVRKYLEGMAGLDSGSSSRYRTATAWADALDLMSLARGRTTGIEAAGGPSPGQDPPAARAVACAVAAVSLLYLRGAGSIRMSSPSPGRLEFEWRRPEGGALDPSWHAAAPSLMVQAFTVAVTSDITLSIPGWAASSGSIHIGWGAPSA